MAKVIPEPYYTCDCCALRIKERYAVRHLKLDMVSYSLDWDLCDKCADNIEGYIKALKETRRNASNH